MFDGIDSHLVRQSSRMEAALKGRAGPSSSPSVCDWVRGCKQLVTLAFWRAFTAELFGTMMLVFFGTASTITLDIAPSVVQIALTFGFIVVAMAYTFGHISGGHLNPAVTLGCLIASRINFISAIFYMIAQFGGGIIGSALLYGLIDDARHGTLGANALASVGISDVQGLFIEVIMTFVLVIVVLAVTDPNRPMFSLAPLVIGLTVGVCHLIGVPTTGTSVNPARALGPPLLKNDFPDYFWIYIVGPFVGAIIAAALYRFWFDPYTPMRDRCRCDTGGHRDSERRRSHDDYHRKRRIHERY